MNAEAGIDAIANQPPHFSLGFILAGGYSSRMGSDKAKLRIGNHSMLEIARSVLDSANLNQSYIVGGDAADIIEKQPGHGPANAICDILSRFNSDSVTRSAYLLFMPVDMPCMSVVSINKLIESARRNSAAVYYDKHFLPLVIPLTAEIQCLSKQLSDSDPCPSVRKLLNILAARPIPFSGSRRELLNINRPEELAALVSTVQ